jgi:hypothetical protein
MKFLRASVILCLIVTLLVCLAPVAQAATTLGYTRANGLIVGNYRNDVLTVNPYSGATVLDGAFTLNNTLDIAKTFTGATGDHALDVRPTQGSTALTGTLDGIYIRATAGDTGKAGTIRGAEIGARVAEDAGAADGAAVVTGGYFWADTKTENAVKLRGLEVSLDGAAGGTSTLASGLVIFNNSSATQTTSVGVDINEGSASGRKAFTYDVRMQNGETIDNATNGTVQVTSGVVKHAVDAAAYWTATQADAAGVTFDSTSDGTAGFAFSDPVTYPVKTIVNTDGSEDLTAAQSGTWVIATKADGATTVGLPAAASTAAGTWFRISQTADQNLKISATAGDNTDSLITLNSADSDYVTYDQAGQKIGATCIVVATGSKWLFTSNPVPP